MADFLNSWKSFQTLWNASKTVLNWFVIASATVCVDLGDYQGFENYQGSKIGRFWAKGLGYSPLLWTWPIFWTPGNRSKLSEPFWPNLQNRSKMICECFRDCLCQFRVNSQGSKIGRFWEKGLGYSPWFWTWPIFWTPGNSSKLSETPPKPF